MRDVCFEKNTTKLSCILVVCFRYLEMVLWQYGLRTDLLKKKKTIKHPPSLPITDRMQDRFKDFFIMWLLEIFSLGRHNCALVDLPSSSLAIGFSVRSIFFFIFYRWPVISHCRSDFWKFMLLISAIAHHLGIVSSTSN